MLRHLLRPTTLLIGAAVLPIVGCADNAPPTLRVVPATQPTTYVIDFSRGFYATRDDGTIDVVLLRDGPARDAAPGQPLRTEVANFLEHTVHVRLHWLQPQRGIGDADPTNATVDWVVRPSDGRGLSRLRYSGAGHARVYPRADGSADFVLSNAAVRFLEADGPFEDSLGRSLLGGRGVIQRDTARVDALLESMQTRPAAAAVMPVLQEGPPPRTPQP
jgi:hypothetical protein